MYVTIFVAFGKKFDSVLSININIKLFTLYIHKLPATTKNPFEMDKSYTLIHCNWHFS